MLFYFLSKFYLNLNLIISYKFKIFFINNIYFNFKKNKISVILKSSLNIIINKYISYNLNKNIVDFTAI